MESETVQMIEWGGAGSGILGAILMSMNVEGSPYAYVLWLVSSVLLSVLALVIGHPGLFLQNAAYTVINVWGIKRWILARKVANGVHAHG